MIRIITIIMILFFISCNKSEKSDYLENHMNWKERRLERLKGKTGWLNLAGLYELEEGINTIGSDSSNSIVFPMSAPEYIGKIIKNDSILIFKSFEGTNVFSDNEKVEKMQLKDDSQEGTTLLETGSYAWFIIRRGDKQLIRLRNYEHPRIKKLNHIPAFPVSTHWIIEAKLQPFSEAKKFEVETFIGTTENYEAPGELIFKIDNEEYSLIPFKAGNGYFIIFGDRTSGKETYPAGRFLYAEKKRFSKKVTLDFNKAYNPPCAFSPYATCPLPPGENILGIQVEAGEKIVHLD